jgi:hypothetical protein
LRKFIKKHSLRVEKAHAELMRAKKRSKKTWIQMHSSGIAVKQRNLRKKLKELRRLPSLYYQAIPILRAKYRESLRIGSQKGDSVFHAESTVNGPKMLKEAELQSGDAQTKDLENSLKNTSVLLEIAQNKLKERRTKNRSRLEIPTKEALWILADKCRFKNEKINFSALASELKTSYHTAQIWCKQYGIT